MNRSGGGGGDLGRSNGEGFSAVIGFDVCQEGNSFSPGLLRYPPVSVFTLAKRLCQDKFVCPSLVGQLIGVL